MGADLLRFEFPKMTKYASLKVPTYNIYRLHILL